MSKLEWNIAWNELWVVRKMIKKLKDNPNHFSNMNITMEHLLKKENHAKHKLGIAQQNRIN